MDINYLAVLVCGIIAMALGAVWYGPMFGKKWMEIVGADKIDIARREEMMHGVWKLYLTNFILVLFQAWALAHIINAVADNATGGLKISLGAWAVFIMPTIAAASMWNNDSAKVSSARFLIQSGYQLVLFVVFGFILSMWR